MPMWQTAMALAFSRDYTAAATEMSGAATRADSDEAKKAAAEDVEVIKGIGERYQELLKAAGTVTAKLVRWLAERDYIDCDSAKDAGDRAREASRDLPMADRLGMLLHDLTDQAPAIDPDAATDADWVEDYLAITDVEPGKLWFEGGVGPIAVPREASDLARPGWSSFLTAARTGGRWRLLEIGVVYP